MQPVLWALLFLVVAMNSTHAPLRSVVSFVLAKSFRGRLVKITDLAQLNIPHFSELKSNALSLAFAKHDETPTLDLENMLGGGTSLASVFGVVLSWQ